MPYATAKVQQILSENYRAERVMFVIITDGMENVNRYVSDSVGSRIAYEAIAQAQCAIRMVGAPSATWNAAPMADAAARGPQTPGRCRMPWRRH